MKISTLITTLGALVSAEHASPDFLRGGQGHMPGHLHCNPKDDMARCVPRVATPASAATTSTSTTPPTTYIAARAPSTVVTMMHNSTSKQPSYYMKGGETWVVGTHICQDHVCAGREPDHPLRTSTPSLSTTVSSPAFVAYPGPSVTPTGYYTVGTVTWALLPPHCGNGICRHQEIKSMVTAPISTSATPAAAVTTTDAVPTASSASASDKVHIQVHAEEAGSPARRGRYLGPYWPFRPLNRPHRTEIDERDMYERDMYAPTDDDFDTASIQTASIDSDDSDGDRVGVDQGGVSETARGMRGMRDMWRFGRLRNMEREAWEREEELAKHAIKEDEAVPEPAASDSFRAPILPRGSKHWEKSPLCNRPMREWPLENGENAWTWWCRSCAQDIHSCFI
jgi:hypothetical protein